MDVRRRS